MVTIVLHLIGGQVLNVEDPDGSMSRRMADALGSNAGIGWISVSQQGKNYHAINMANVVYFRFT